MKVAYYLSFAVTESEVSRWPQTSHITNQKTALKSRSQKRGVSIFESRSRVRKIFLLISKPAKPFLIAIHGIVQPDHKLQKKENEKESFNRAPFAQAIALLNPQSRTPPLSPISTEY